MSRNVAARARRLTMDEQPHRRATLLAIGGLIVLGTSPVFGHHLPFDMQRMLEGVDHLGALCLTALHVLLTPIHRVIHLAIVAGVVYAAWNRYRAWRLLRSSIGLLEVRQARHGDPFWTAAKSVAVDPGLLRVVPELPVPAFTAGLVTMRIYICQALCSLLTPDELAAVIAHEGAHVTRRDPLRLALLRALACTLFWIPALRRLADDISDQAELSADEIAARGRPLVLASAILRVAACSARKVPTRTEVGFSKDELLECRVRRLAGQDVSVRSHVTRRSLVGAAAALAVVWTSGLLMAHPLSAQAGIEHADHCNHRQETAFAHLFCLGSPFGISAGECPHRNGEVRHAAL